MSTGAVDCIFTRQGRVASSREAFCHTRLEHVSFLYHPHTFAASYKSNRIDDSFRRVHNCFTLGLDMQTLPATRHQVGGLGGLSHSLLATPRSNGAGCLIDEACCWGDPQANKQWISRSRNLDLDPFPIAQNTDVLFVVKT